MTDLDDSLLTDLMSDSTMPDSLGGLVKYEGELVVSDYVKAPLAALAGLAIGVGALIAIGSLFGKDKPND